MFHKLQQKHQQATAATKNATISFPFACYFQLVGEENLVRLFIWASTPPGSLPAWFVHVSIRLYHFSTYSMRWKVIIVVVAVTRTFVHIHLERVHT